MPREPVDRSKDLRAVHLVAAALGAVAIGAIAVGAVAIGRLAIGRLAIKKAHFGTMEIDELIVHDIRSPEQRRRR